MAGQPVQIIVTARQREVLETLVRTRSTSQRLAERCRIVLMASDDWNNQNLADNLGVDRQRARRWRRRWNDARVLLAEAEDEGATDKDLRALIIWALTDSERPGAPPKFTPEQVVAIIALACEPPSDSGLPVSHWTPDELAREAVKRGIVDCISGRQVDRFLAKRSSARTRVSTG